MSGGAPARLRPAARSVAPAGAGKIIHPEPNGEGDSHARFGTNLHTKIGMRFQITRESHALDSRRAIFVWHANPLCLETRSITHLWPGLGPASYAWPKMGSGTCFIISVVIPQPHTQPPLAWALAQLCVRDCGITRASASEEIEEVQRLFGRGTTSLESLHRWRSVTY